LGASSKPWTPGARGLKATKAGRFTDEQKLFLLVYIFGFNRAEVARMLTRQRDSVWRRVKRLEDRCAALFAGDGHNAMT
jgi:DNA-directed RNA polymerase specialized sigma24 family protein